MTDERGQAVPDVGAATPRVPTELERRHRAGKRIAEQNTCPTCGRLGALTRRVYADGSRVCRWQATGRCPR